MHTLGIGSIHDTISNSYIIAGLNFWTYNLLNPEKKKLVRDSLEIIDQRLIKRVSFETKTHIKYLLQPPKARELHSQYSSSSGDKNAEGTIPTFRFPRWYRCPNCWLLRRVKANASENDSALFCKSPIKFDPNRKGLTCSDRKNGTRMLPIRFVVACENGHIMDFPWIEWAHKDTKMCDNPILFYKTSPRASLASTSVLCYNCKSKPVHLSGVSSREANKNPLFNIFNDKCPGTSPWLGETCKDENCDAKLLVTVLKGASDTYFPETRTSLFIPNRDNKIHIKVIEKQKDGIFKKTATISPSDDLKNLGKLGDINYEFVKSLAVVEGFEYDSFKNTVENFRSEQNSETNPETIEVDYKLSEYNTIIGERFSDEQIDDFDHIHMEMENYDPKIKNIFSKIIKINKLKVTKAPIGFKRINLESSNKNLGKFFNPEKKIDWWPAIQSSGEGVFFEIDKIKLDQHINENPNIQNKVRELIKRNRDGETPCSNLTIHQLTPSFVILHTLSHLIINQLSLDAGYSLSSLSERIYCSDEEGSMMSGILIYTASDGASETLGGLVRQLKSDSLLRILVNLKEKFSVCSNDPICIESNGQGLGGLNYAACHACSLLPETSCEFMNIFLDRNLIIGGGNIKGFLDEF